MAKTKISEYDATAANNTDVNSINIAEGCAPSGINNAIRQVMADLKDFQQGTKGDPFLGPVTPSTLTLTGLAANRILYTNGSKVVSTSDNVQFDGTTVTINSLATTTFSASGVATFGVGSAGAPGITFAGDTNTGIYSPAADTIAFTEGGVEAMRISSSANVGIGTNSPTYKLDVTGTDGNVFRTQFNSIGIVNFIGSDAGYTGTSTNHPLAFVTNGSERMRIDSAGNVGIGTASPSDSQSFGRAVDTRGANGAAYYAATSDNTTRSFFATFTGAGYTGTETNHPFLFRTNNTERMRIDSSGRLLFGASSLPFSNSNFSAGSFYLNENFYIGNSGGTNQYNIRMDGFQDQLFFVWSNGNSQTSALSYPYGGTGWVNSSDETLKDIIEPITNAIEKVSQLRSVIGKFKTEKEGTRHPFLIAQDVQKVLPEAVYVNKSRVEGEPDTLGVGYTDVIPLLVASIKELKEELDSVKAELQTLKGN